MLSLGSIKTGGISFIAFAFLCSICLPRWQDVMEAQATQLADCCLYQGHCLGVREDHQRPVKEYWFCA